MLPRERPADNLRFPDSQSASSNCSWLDASLFVRCIVVSCGAAPNRPQYFPKVCIAVTSPMSVQAYLSALSNMRHHVGTKLSGNHRVPVQFKQTVCQVVPCHWQESLPSVYLHLSLCQYCTQLYCSWTQAVGIAHCIPSLLQVHLVAITNQLLL